MIAERLPLIFPEGTPNRTYCIRELSASTVFSALYIGAVEGSGVYLGPVHVYRMTIEQAAKAEAEERQAYAANILKALQGIEWVVSRGHSGGSMQERTLRRRYSSSRSP
jgi:hypothetical protein